MSSETVHTTEVQVTLRATFDVVEGTPVATAFKAWLLDLPASALAIVVANAHVDVVSVRPRYRSCPNGHLWSPGGPLKLSTKVCPTCGWLDERAFDGGDR